MWKKIDIGLIENPPRRLEATDECFHAREYAAGKGYSHSETNQLISNLKKPVTERGTPRWPYKERAIERFAKELVPLLKIADEKYFIAPVPSSKRVDDPQYDNRLELVIDLVCRSCSNAVKATPIIRQNT